VDCRRQGHDRQLRKFGAKRLRAEVIAILSTTTLLGGCRFA
jgi:hypothetical protein